MRCAQCGKELSDSAKFCTGCGTPVEQKESSSDYYGEAADVMINQPLTSAIESPKIQEGKKSWNDKNTIMVLVGVMLVAVIIGLVIKNRSLQKEILNSSYQEEYGENIEEHDDNYIDSTEESHDYVQQETEVENTTSQEYILPESSTRYLTKDELVGLTAEQCRIARNEIYARHGRMFKDEGLQNYFGSFDWYVPTIAPDDFQESMLNEYEIANRDLLVQYETEQGYR